jgi:hypothetical protein
MGANSCRRMKRRSRPAYLAALVYRMLTHGEAWVDRGATRF